MITSMKSKIVLSFAICLIGCTSVQPDVFQYNIAIDPVAVDQPEYESIVESIEYIPLETKEESIKAYFVRKGVVSGEETTPFFSLFTIKYLKKWT